MATAGFTFEIPSKVAPGRLFQAGCGNSHKILPKIIPDIVTSAQLFNGTGGPGTIKHLTFTQALPYSYFKEVVDVCDPEKFESVYRLTEGGDLGTKVSTALYTLKLHPTEDGGCVFKMTSEYTMLPGVDADEYVNADKEHSILLFKAVEGYLLTNPEACT